MQYQYLPISKLKRFNSKILSFIIIIEYRFDLALKSSPSKRGRGGLAVGKYCGPGAAWSASQLPFMRDENIYDLRGARSFPTLEDDGGYCGGGVRGFYLFLVQNAIFQTLVMTFVLCFNSCNFYLFILCYLVHSLCCLSQNTTYVLFSFYLFSLVFYFIQFFLFIFALY